MRIGYLLLTVHSVLGHVQAVQIESSTVWDNFLPGLINLK